MSSVLLCLRYSDHFIIVLGAVCIHSDAIAVKQSQVDKLYASLKDLALERRDKLGEVLKLYKLNREIEDLEQWIMEREVVAGSHELGQDFEHVTVIHSTFVWFLVLLHVSLNSTFCVFFVALISPENISEY